jgi:hypothetical protein
MPIPWLLHQRFESLTKIRGLQIPSLFIHGTADETVPVTMGETLYQMAIAPKQLLIVPGAGHNNVAKTAGETYNQAIREFHRFAQQQQAQGPKTLPAELNQKTPVSLQRQTELCFNLSGG